jgi:hypothetical protein
MSNERILSFERESSHAAPLLTTAGVRRASLAMLGLTLRYVCDT